MKVSGFAFVRNGVKYNYPFEESIKSVLPLVDEMIVNVPSSEDDTYERVLNIKDPKIKVFQSEWDDSDKEKVKNGKIIALHTNLALEKCSGDWCFYIQVDELIHEDDYKEIRSAMERYLNSDVDGLLFNYLHFYGSYNCIATSKGWYRREVRIIKNNKGIKSYKDAQGFRYSDDSKLKVAHIKARIFHYGWVRPIENMRTKMLETQKYWTGNKKDEENKKMQYQSNLYGLKKYKGNHPLVMKDKVKSINWDFNFKSKISSYRDFRYFLSDIFERLTGIRLFEYKGYKKIK